MLKKKYWQDGLFYYEKHNKKLRVCFHSNDIRNARGPFSEEVINRPEFLTDLDQFIVETDFTIMSATLNKEEHVKKYSRPIHPYDLCMVFILEKFAKYFLNSKGKNGLVIIEARGEREDRFTLKNIVKTLEQGSPYCAPDHYKSIKGVYFNPKWCLKDENLTSYFGLEIADIVSYPIHKYCRTGVKDRALQSFEHKTYGYPDNIHWGIKMFP